MFLRPKLKLYLVIDADGVERFALVPAWSPSEGQTDRSGQT